MMWVKWETEGGGDLLGRSFTLDVLDRVFMRDELKAFSCLKYIDSYDDTSYNHLQMAEVIKELAIVEELDLSETERQELLGLYEFIACLDGKLRNSSFLKFYGE